MDKFQNLPQVEIYTDGSCKPNPGRGGWAALLRFKNHEKIISGNHPNTTSNRMELLAAINALRKLKPKCKVDIFVDSQYLRKGITYWLPKWIGMNWLTSEKKPVKNSDLWKELKALTDFHKVNWHWTKAHIGEVSNELVNSLARQEMLKAANVENGQKDRYP